MEASMVGAAAPLPQLDLFGCGDDLPKVSVSIAPKRKKTVTLKAEVAGDPVWQLSQLTLELLSQPMVGPEVVEVNKFGMDFDDIDLIVEEVNAEIEEDASARTVEFFGDNGTKSWSDNDHSILHEAMISWQLGQFTSRNNVEGKLEALEWIFQPDVYERRVIVRPDGSHYTRYIYASQIPFTFQHACLRAGYSAEALQLGLEHVLRKRGLGELLKHITGDIDNV